MDKSSAQTIVKVFAILNWIGAASSVIMALIFFAGGGLIASLFGSGGGLLGALVAAGGVVFLVLAVVSIVLGIGLWKLRSWARILVIVLGALAVVAGIMLFPMGILTVVVGGLEIYLFAFNSDVKSLFTTGAAAAKKK